MRYQKAFSLFLSPVLCLVLHSSYTSAENRSDTAALQGVFEGQKPATIVIESLSGDGFYYNSARAELRYSPASTFKIVNTLIAVEQGVVEGPAHPFRWDGVQRSITTWNQNQTLASAFRISCVWCYQQIARSVGKEAYRKTLARMNYGRLRDPFKLTTFWLDESFTISAMEQVSFLKALYERKLPFSQSAYEVLETIMLVEQTDSYRLYAKTGWAVDSEPKIGWYVGYLVNKDEGWAFALNIDTDSANELGLREALTRSSLKAVGLIR